MKESNTSEFFALTIKGFYPPIEARAMLDAAWMMRPQYVAKTFETGTDFIPSEWIGVKIRGLIYQPEDLKSFRELVAQLVKEGKEQFTS